MFLPSKLWDMDSRLKDCERKTAHQFKILQLREKISIKPSGLSTLNYETKFGLNSYSKHSQDIRPVNFNGGTTSQNQQTDYNYSRTEEMASLNRKTIDTNQLIMGMTTHISKKSAEERIPAQPQGQNDWDNPFRGPNNPHLMDTVKSKDSQEAGYPAQNTKPLDEERQDIGLGMDTVQGSQASNYKPPHLRGRGEYTAAELLSTPFLTQLKSELAHPREEGHTPSETQKDQTHDDPAEHHPEEDGLYDSPEGDEAYIHDGEEEKTAQNLPHLLPDEHHEAEPEDEGEVIEPVTYLGGGYEEEEREPAEEQEAEEEEAFTMTHKQSRIVYMPENSEPLPQNVTVGAQVGMGSFDEPVTDGQATPQGSQDREAVPQ